MKKNLIFFFIIYFILFCKSSLVKKQELEQWNQSLQKEYIAINDLYLYEYDFQNERFIPVSDSVIIKKNTKVSIQIEAVDDWLRIRVFDVKNTKNEYFGDVVFYLTIPENIKIETPQIKKIIDNFITLNFREIN
ncbi:MAG: type II secretion system-associated lipoprotein [Leptospiraceae bacterium]|jgi:type II secretion system-associated lipoprotein|nr:type II secretion system-associated lipoprotein [Leptospiraceae bacterium]